MAREPSPQGVHVAYVIVDKVIDLEWTRKRFQDRPEEFFIKPRAIADETGMWLSRIADAEFCHGDCRSLWKRPSASRPWRMPWLVMVGRKSSTPTRAHNSRARR